MLSQTASPSAHAPTSSSPRRRRPTASPSHEEHDDAHDVVRDSTERFRRWRRVPVRSAMKAFAATIHITAATPEQTTQFLPRPRCPAKSSQICRSREKELQIEINSLARSLSVHLDVLMKSTASIRLSSHRTC